MAATESPVRIRRVKRKVAPDQEVDMIEVERRDTGEVLAHCPIGDDLNVERIADILSAKRLPKPAMEVRLLAMAARHEKPPTNRGWLKHLRRIILGVA